MAKIDDAYRRLQIAKQSFGNRDYASCLRECQGSVELSVKSLLEKLDIEYERQHDVSGEIWKAVNKVKPSLKDYEFSQAKGDLGRAAVMLSLLGSVKNYANYGLEKTDVSANDIFDILFKEFAEASFRLAEITYVRIMTMLAWLSR